ncbi:hypothetical protein NC652_033635 [Populus alba x Populus x berolinensis]|nr:hypothetical protein NC652_033635 [Populus alba x Populus x berolinensis]
MASTVDAYISDTVQETARIFHRFELEKGDWLRCLACERSRPVPVALQHHMLPCLSNPKLPLHETMQVLCQEENTQTSLAISAP